MLEPSPNELESPASTVADVYFDTLERTLIVGAAEHQSVTEAGRNPNDLVPLSDLLRTSSGLVISKNPDRLDISGWEREDYISYGQWLVALSSEPEQPELTRDVLSRASRLGLGPSEMAIARRFDSMRGYYDALGLERVRRRNGWNHWDRKLATQHLADILTSGEYDTLREGVQALAKRGLGPSADVYMRRFGSFSNLLESAGYLTKTSLANWTEQDYVDWGVRFMRANGGLSPTKYMISYLSRRLLGPSEKPIYERFGSLVSYKEQVERSYQEQREAEQVERDRLLWSIKSGTESGSLPTELFHEADADERKLEVYAKYLIIKKHLPNLSTEKVCALANARTDTVVNSILRENQHLKSSNVELSAITLGIFDLLWPLEQEIARLRVPPNYRQIVRQERERRQKKNS